jgi:hypothetical protein
LAENAVSLAVDGIGLIPEAGGVSRLIGNEAGLRGIVADRAGANVVKAVGTSGGVINGIMNMSDTSRVGLASTALTIVGFIPGAGQIASGASLALDLYKTWEAVSACPDN